MNWYVYAFKSIDALRSGYGNDSLEFYLIRLLSLPLSITSL